jgi:hypothetical protein
VLLNMASIYVNIPFDQLTVELRREQIAIVR